MFSNLSPARDATVTRRENLGTGDSPFPQRGTPPIDGSVHAALDYVFFARRRRAEVEEGSRCWLMTSTISRLRRKRSAFASTCDRSAATKSNGSFLSTPQSYADF